MRAVVQRVKQAKVTIGEEVVGAISEGLVIFLGVGENDDQADARYLAEKIAYLRIFNDTNEKLNLAAVDVGAEMLVVSSLRFLVIAVRDGVRVLRRQPHRYWLRIYTSILWIV